MYCSNIILIYIIFCRYRIGTNVSARVGRFNVRWNSVGLDEDEQFYKAVDVVAEEFLDVINYTHKVWLPARNIVKEAIEKRFEVSLINNFDNFTIILLYIFFISKF